MNLKDFRESFEKVEDFRESHKVKHNLLEIIFVAIVATVANSNTWLEIEAFGEIKENLLKRYVKLET